MRLGYLAIALALLAPFGSAKGAVTQYQPKGPEANQNMVIPRVSDAPTHGEVTVPEKYKMTFSSNNVNYGLIPRSEIRKYPYVERYLDLDNKAIEDFFILQEPLNVSVGSRRIDIPKGYIWDGASIPNWFSEVGVLDKSNTRYQAALRAGLVHDFMYRDPSNFSRDFADEVFCWNLRKYGNPDPWKVCEGVKKIGGYFYNKHKKRQNRGEYAVFTPELYEQYLKMYYNDPPTLEDVARNIDNPLADWCSCDHPGCRDEIFEENGRKGFVTTFICTNCGKANREYARRALANAARAREQGGQTQWIGQGAESRARAASK